MRSEIYGYTAIGNRLENEDSIAFEKINDKSLYAITADGLGSHGGGKCASETAVKAMLKCRSETSIPDNDKILSWFNDANSEILRKRESADKMKTTAVFLFIYEDKAVWAHIGDSRLYHFYKGEIADATEDHSVCQISVKLGEITRKEIPGHPDRSRLLKVLGEESIEPEIHPMITLKAGFHAFLLCTDGLWERLKEEEILIDLQKSETPEQWLKYLRITAENRNGTDADNNSAVAVFVRE